MFNKLVGSDRSNTEDIVLRGYDSQKSVLYWYFNWAMYAKFIYVFLPTQRVIKLKAWWVLSAIILK